MERRHTSKSMDANKLIAEMENEKEHVLIYGTSKCMDATVFQWREGLSIRVMSDESMEKEKKNMYSYMEHLRAWMRTN
jgi:hypothetical protein